MRGSRVEFMSMMAAAPPGAGVAGCQTSNIEVGMRCGDWGALRGEDTDDRDNGLEDHFPHVDDRPHDFEG